MGIVARKYNVEDGTPTMLSKLTSTTPSKKADKMAPNPSIKKSFLGCRSALAIKCSNLNLKFLFLASVYLYQVNSKKTLIFLSKYIAPFYR